MFDSEDEKIITELYREALSEELSHPEIQQAKQQLLASFFVPQAGPVFSFLAPSFLIPTVFAAVLFFGFLKIEKHFAMVKGPSAPMNLMFGTIMEESRALRAQQLAEEQAKLEAIRQEKLAKAAAEDPIRNHMKPRVLVKRVSSKVGPTMVYQRAYRDVPVTIVWVFPSGGKSS